MNRSAVRSQRRLAASSHAMFECLECRSLLSGSLARVDDFSGLKAVQAADIDADGDVDLLGQRKTPDGTAVWAVRWNDGSGQFDTFTDVPAAPESYTWVIAIDQDGDGDRDLLAHGFAGAVYRLVNSGAGTFGAPAVVNGVSLPGDKPRDLGVAGGSPQWLVLSMQGLYEVWTFRDGAIEVAAFPTATVNQIAGIADLDADGDLDVALRIEPTGGRRIGFAVNNGGSFSAHQSMALSGMGARFQDLDGDGRGDLWWTEGSSLYVSGGLGTGAFDAGMISRISATSESTQRPIADVNGDGRVDAIVFPYNPVESQLAVVLQREDGTFEHGASSPIGFLAGNILDTLGVDIDGDGRSELLLTVEDADSGVGALSTFLLRFVPGPAISMTVDPHPTVGNLTVRIGVQPTQPGQAITGVSLYADVNNNALLDPADVLLGSSSTLGGGGLFVVTATSLVIPIGDVRLFALATQTPAISSGELAVIATVWTRTFYPEGWRNDTTARERVVLFNPHEEPVSFRLLARYERGERDGTVAEGVLQPGERRTIVVTNPNRPGRSRVRKDVGYALEVQSERRLAAMLEHFDTLGRDASQADFGALVGEQLTDRTAQTWTLPEISPSLDHFLLFYNPNPNNVLVHIAFTDADGISIGVDQLLEPFRRGGVAVKDVTGLNRNRVYSALITTSVTETNHGAGIVASITSYDLAKGSAYTSLAYASDHAAGLDLPIIELGADHSSRVVVFNPSLTTISMGVRIDFNIGGSRSLTLTIPANRRVFINPNRNAPAGATAALVHVDAPGGAFVTTYIRSRGDSAATVADRRASTWSFAQAYLPRPSGAGASTVGAGITDFVTLGLANASSEAANVTVRYVFDSGQTITREFTIGAGAFRAIPLHSRRFITSIGGAFSIVVESDRAVAAALSQWSTEPAWGPSPGARGGWWTLGTPLNG